MFYMHIEDVRSMADLVYWCHTHAFVAPIAASLVAFLLVGSFRRRY